ncbi:MAG TPA: IS4 family transposase, partial [Nitrospiraceae bacterium]|nr:IS4 family transposase [Nitrospiraceae bacterium]
DIFTSPGLHAPAYIQTLCCRYEGNNNVRSCNQHLCMVFALLTYRKGLRGIEACLRA